MRPPVIAAAILRVVLGADAHEALIGDMRESYMERVRARGSLSASLWFWRETLSACASFAGRRSAGGSMLTDLRVSLRALRNAPLTTGISVLTLGLGIGAIAAVFSVVDPILLRPLAYPRPDHLMMVWELDQTGATSNTSFATFSDVQRETKTLKDAAVMGLWQPTLTLPNDAERLQGQRVSWNYFRALGVRPAIGRDFTAEEDPPGHLTVILSYGLWRRRFGGDSSIVGRNIDISGSAFLVAGVMGPDFQNVASPNAQIWRPLGYQSDLPFACRTCRHLRLVARVRNEVTPEAASTELNAISAKLFAQFPKEYAAPGMRLVPLQEQMTAPFKAALYVLLAAAAVLGLIAAANVINLQLARAMQRQSSLAVRVMLGASRGRIIRLLLAEGFVLAGLAGVAGWSVAALLVPLFVSRLPVNMPGVAGVHVDHTTVFLLCGVSFALAMILGLLPAFRFDGRRIAGTLRLSRRVTGYGSVLSRGSLVVGEVALALMLLVGAGLLSRSLSTLLAVNSGVNPAHLLTMEAQATGPKYVTNESVWENHRRIVEAVRAVPGIETVGFSNQLPLGGDFDAYGVRAQDKPLANIEQAPAADRYAVSPDFVRAIGARVVQGRGFDDNDNRADGTPVAMVSSALAATIWPGDSPIGKRIQVGALTAPWREVVGVVADVHHRGLDNGTTYQLYVPERQWIFVDNIVALAVRTTGDPAPLAAAIREAVHNVDPSQPIMKFAPMTEIVAQSVAQRRLSLLLFVAFSSVALILAGAGVYGVLATSVSARAREIGVRSALGATPGRVVRLVVRDSALLVGAGSALGLVGVALLSRYLRSMLFGVRPTDPVTLAAVTAGVAAIAMVAAVLPALRATQIDPAEVLRGE